jgi:hypothetical protein
LERWRWTITRAEEIEAPSPTPMAAPSASATRPPTLSGKFDVSRLFNGITVRSEVETSSGAAASEERVDPMSYAIDLKLRARVPTPNRTVDELGKVSPDLGTLLPGLATMIKPEAVSPLFAQLYETKVRELRENLNRLDLLLSRHNFYDCQTVLALRHPESKRRALLFQAGHGRGRGWLRWRSGTGRQWRVADRSNRSPVFVGERNRIGQILTHPESKIDCIAWNWSKRRQHQERKRDLKNAGRRNCVMKSPR